MMKLEYTLDICREIRFGFRLYYVCVGDDCEPSEQRRKKKSRKSWE